MKYNIRDRTGRFVKVKSVQRATWLEEFMDWVTDGIFYCIICSLRCSSGYLIKQGSYGKVVGFVCEEHKSVLEKEV